MRAGGGPTGTSWTSAERKRTGPVAMPGRDRTPAVTKHLVDLLFPSRTFVVRVADGGWGIEHRIGYTYGMNYFDARKCNADPRSMVLSDEVYSALGVIRG